MGDLLINSMSIHEKKCLWSSFLRDFGVLTSGFTYSFRVLGGLSKI